MLLSVLREQLGLTAAKPGCGEGVCGACTVLVDGVPVRSCMVTAADLAGRPVTTLEGLAPAGALHPLQQAFHENHALQCGFCTPGFLMTAVAFLQETQNPTEAQVREAISGNICRCTGYAPIVQAILQARRGG